MSEFQDLIDGLPDQFKNKQRIRGLLKAFARQDEELKVVFEQLRNRSLENDRGKTLDYDGTIVQLTRAEAAEISGVDDFDELDDDTYRLFLKYKALNNATNCTYFDLMTSAKLLFKADPIYYSESKNNPAAFSISIGTALDDKLMRLIQKSDLATRASGVKASIMVFEKNFFGFADTNRYALGFGQGKFAQEV